MVVQELLCRTPNDKEGVHINLERNQGVIRLLECSIRFRETRKLSKNLLAKAGSTLVGKWYGYEVVMVALVGRDLLDFQLAIANQSGKLSTDIDEADFGLFRADMQNVIQHLASGNQAPLSCFK